jgi:hypothetical protein
MSGQSHIQTADQERSVEMDEKTILEEIQRRLKITAMFGYVVGVSNKRHNEHKPSMSDEEALEHAELIDALYQAQLADKDAEIARLRALPKEIIFPIIAENRMASAAHSDVMIVHGLDCEITIANTIWDKFKAALKDA